MRPGGRSKSPTVEWTLIALFDSRLDQLSYSRDRQALTNRESQRGLLGQIDLQAVRVPSRVECDVLFVGGDVNQASPVLIEGDAIADLFFSIWRFLPDHLSKLPEQRLCRLRRSRNVRVDCFLAVPFAHFFV